MFATLKYSCALALLLSAAAGASAQRMPQLRETVDPRIEALVQPIVGTKTPGVAVVVLQKGNLVHARAYGLRDVASRAPFTMQTPTYIASLAKMFTAHAVLQQVDRGKLKLETPIGMVVSEVPAYARNLSIAQLLTHTSGMVDHLDIGGDGRTYTYQDVIRMLRDADSLLFAPQSRSSYSNSAYVLLAAALEKVTGIQYEQYLETEFFQPFGMRSAKVVTRTDQLPANRARGYAADTNGFRLHDYENVSSTKGAGATFASMEDLFLWAHALRAGRALSDSLQTRAATPAVRTNGKLTPWGMGWLAESHGTRDPLNGKTYVAATGNLRGFSALMKWYQAEDLVILWVANANSSEVFDALHPIAQVVLLGNGGT